MECIGEAINYIEENITQELTIESIAKKALISPFYFQKGFAMLCGFAALRFRSISGAAGSPLPAASLLQPMKRSLILQSNTVTIHLTASRNLLPVFMALRLLPSEKAEQW